MERDHRRPWRRPISAARSRLKERYGSFNATLVMVAFAMVALWLIVVALDGARR
jgi:hypothetical protein